MPVEIEDMTVQVEPPAADAGAPAEVVASEALPEVERRHHEALIAHLRARAARVAAD